MSNDPAKRVFLSYGRMDASELADRLASDLARHELAGYACYDPWQDRVEIEGGKPWTEQIAAALRETDGVLALLSPHAVRTRFGAKDGADSVCLDEISYARFGANKPILPLMVVQCTPPFEIFRLDYVDFTTWRDSAKYQEAVRKLLASLASLLRNEPPKYRAWDERLKPLDFGAFLSTRRRSFTGRQWLYEDLANWAKTDEGPALLITGEPGIGKSAIVADLVHRNPDGCVIAYHCCQASTPITLRPGRFIRSIAAMIASQHPAYEALLDQTPYREVLSEQQCESDPESAFEIGVLAALGSAGRPREEGFRLLLVDALDEALALGDARSIVALLAGHVDRLPHWLKLVATTRNEDKVLQDLAGLKARKLDAGDPRNIEDLGAYIAERASQSALAGKITASGRASAEVVEDLKRLANGNFLYAQQALEGIERGLLGLDELGNLPPGLGPQFKLFFSRQFKSDLEWEPIKALLQVLVAVYEPVGEREIASATELDPENALPQKLSVIGQFLRVHEEGQSRRYALYHRSLLEWLTDPQRKAEAYRINPADGHERLANGLYQMYGADRLGATEYALKYLPLHLAEAARRTGATTARRLEAQRSLAAFVLDPIFHERRLEDPYAVNVSLKLALETVAGGPSIESAPLAIRLALGWQAFRRERLDGSRLFRLASEGRIDEFERELQLYPADDHWLAAARLMAAWLAFDNSRTEADALRQGARSGTDLDERVAAVFEGREAHIEPLEVQADQSEVDKILADTPGADPERVNPSMLWAHEAPPPSRGLGDPEGVRYLAEFDAPKLVAFAQANPTEGTARFRDYLALNAANAYRVYRNGTLWHTLRAAARHRDPQWVREMLPPLITAVLTGTDREFDGAIRIALSALRAVADPGCRAEFERIEKAEVAALAALEPIRGRGDAWGEHRRRAAALAESKMILLGESGVALLDRALASPPGFAGFQAPASLTLTEALAINGADPDRIKTALQQARHAAQNVQDLVFCARTVSRCNALERRWFSAGKSTAVQVAATVSRFAANPRDPEFAAEHTVGEQYPDRGAQFPASRLPNWMRSVRTLRELSQAYQWPLSDFISANPEIASADDHMVEGRLVQVPDRDWAPMLAAYFAAEVLRLSALARAERVHLILALVPVAASNPTALDTVLSRLLLALRPSVDSMITDLEQMVSAGPTTFGQLRDV